jgi:hypothetical protein
MFILKNDYKMLISVVGQWEEMYYEMKAERNRLHEAIKDAISKIEQFEKMYGAKNSK